MNPLVLLMMSAIQWTDFTINFWLGCIKCSAGCKFCYMFRMLENQGKDPTKVYRNDRDYRQILKIPSGAKVFVSSMTDFFLEIADQWRGEAWRLIKQRSDLTFQILTKRIDNVRDRLPADWGDGYSHVWLGVSIENQDAAYRVVELASLKRTYPNIKIFLSLEPLIGPIDFLSDPKLREAFVLVDWVIIGGESGYETGKYRYRECRLGWMYNLMAQCDVLNIPVFVKQLGTHLGNALNNGHSHGGNFDKFPKGLKRVDFPK